jgi:hypothetical protein
VIGELAATRAAPGAGWSVVIGKLARRAAPGAGWPVVIGELARRAAPGAGWSVVIGELALDATRRRGRLPVVIASSRSTGAAPGAGWPGGHRRARDRRGAWRRRGDPRFDRCTTDACEPASLAAAKDSPATPRRTRLQRSDVHA